MTFLDFQNNIFWLMLPMVGGYVGYQIKELVRTVQELNTKVAVILEKIDSHSEKIEEHAERLKSLEGCKCPLDGIASARV